MRRTAPLLVLFACLLVSGGLWLALGGGPRKGRDVRAALAPDGPDAPGAGGLPAGGAGERPGAEVRPGAREGVVGLAPESAGEDAAAAAAGEAGPELFGRVVDAAGGPVAGARVDLRRAEAWLAVPADLEPIASLGSTHDLRRAESDAEGRFAFFGVEPGDYAIAVRAAGFAPLDRLRQRVPPHERLDLGRFEVTPGVVLQGRVIDGEGAGVPGVRVLRAATPEGGSQRLSAPGVGAPLTESDADGGFVVDTLAPGPWMILFDSPGHRVVELTGVTAPAGARTAGLVVRLDAGHAIAGRVEGVDASKGALRAVARCAGAQVGTAAEELSETERHRARRADVGADGTFLVRGLAPGVQYRLRLEREAPPDPDAAPDVLQAMRWGTVGDVEPALAMAGAVDVVLRSAPQTAVAYRVVDAESGAAVETFFASISGDALRGRTLVSDAAGEPIAVHPGGAVVHDGLRPPDNGTDVRVRLNAPGYAPLESDAFLLRPGERKELGELRLEPAPSVGVRVVDADRGEPIAGARVVLARAAEAEALQRYLDPDSDDAPRRDAKVRMAVTDGAGRAALTAFRGEVCVLRAVAPGRLASEETRAVPPHGAGELELRLGAAGAVVVRVSDSRGRPLSGVYVQHTDPDGNDPARSAWNTEARARQTTGESGEVRFVRLGPGGHRFAAVESGLPMGRDEGADDGGQEVLVRAGAELRLELELPERGGLRAQLLEGGRPLAGALARVEQPAADDARNPGSFWRGPGMADPSAAVSDHEGRILIEGLAAGPYELTVSHGERRMPFTTPVELVPDPREVRIELGLASIEGRVVGEDGAPLQGLAVRVVSPDSQRDFAVPDFRIRVTEDDEGDADFSFDQVGERNIRTDADGRYELRGVRPDEELLVSVQGDYVVPDSRRVPPLGRDEVRAGVDFRLPAAGRVEVLLVGLAAGDRERYRLSLRPEGPGAGRTVRGSTIRGWRPRTTLSSLAPGRWSVEVRRGRDSEPVGTGTVEVVAGETRTVEVAVQ